MLMSAISLLRTTLRSPFSHVGRTSVGAIIKLLVGTVGGVVSLLGGTLTRWGQLSIVNGGVIETGLVNLGDMIVFRARGSWWCDWGFLGSGLSNFGNAGGVARVKGNDTGVHAVGDEEALFLNLKALFDACEFILALVKVGILIQSWHGHGHGGSIGDCDQGEGDSESDGEDAHVG
ncbi:hypothetical protein F5H01DRAFT_334822, partial [Linnemannia elongata]